MTANNYISELSLEISKRLLVTPEIAVKIIEKAIEGGEVDETNLQANLNEWYEKRFLPNIFYVEEEGYARMCVDALKILSNTAASDYGSSRQRDLGQLWADMTRGYLAEYAFTLFLKDKWGIGSNLGHEAGALADYLPTDIPDITIKGVKRAPNLKLGIKGSKWNGIWLDIPGDQFAHSDVHIFIKVGTGRDHLFAYFKHISVFKDKILKKGVEVGSINTQEAENLYNELPVFTKIPAYIAGFAIANKQYNPLSYGGKKGRINYKIKSWNGPISRGDLALIKAQENISGSVEFQGIGRFGHDSGYLFNTGNLLWTDKDWEQNIISKL